MQRASSPELNPDSPKPIIEKPKYTTYIWISSGVLRTIWMYVPAIHDNSPRVLLASATISPQTRQITKVRTANSTVISAPCSSAGISRAMKRGSNGTSVLIEVVEALGWRVLVQPLLIPGDVLAVT